MADWKTYAKAAQRTAQKQAPELRRTAQKQGAEFRQTASQRSTEYRQTAVAAGKVAGRRARDNNLFARLRAAVRDVFLIAAAVFVFYAVIAALGVPLPIGWFLVALVALIAIRFIWAIIQSGREPSEPENAGA